MNQTASLYIGHLFLVNHSVSFWK